MEPSSSLDHAILHSTNHKNDEPSKTLPWPTPFVSFASNPSRRRASSKSRLRSVRQRATALLLHAVHRVAAEAAPPPRTAPLPDRTVAGVAPQPKSRRRHRRAAACVAIAPLLPRRCRPSPPLPATPPSSTPPKLRRRRHHPRAAAAGAVGPRPARRSRSAADPLRRRLAVVPTAAATGERLRVASSRAPRCWCVVSTAVPPHASPLARRLAAMLGWPVSRRREPPFAASSLAGAAALAGAPPRSRYWETG
ncbi:hypothetical protein Scep_020816 [Stephania cephalantha]|uniref:Uncharacterized protein n=1 Tax=Stephania cephalantha TaxID=152367 RepID=A0AAP0F4X6_9MAGN